MTAIQRVKNATNAKSNFKMRSKKQFGVILLILGMLIILSCSLYLLYLHQDILQQYRQIKNQSYMKESNILLPSIHQLHLTISISCIGSIILLFGAFLSEAISKRIAFALLSFAFIIFIFCQLYVFS